MRFALDKTDLIVSQGELDEGQLLRYRKPADPTQLWDEQLLATLRRPHALVNRGGAILAGENSGAGSRLWPGGTLRHGVHTFIEIDRGLIAVGPDSISIVN